MPAIIQIKWRFIQERFQQNNTQRVIFITKTDCSMRCALFLLLLASISKDICAQPSRRTGDVFTGLTIGINYSRVTTEKANPNDIVDIATVTGLGYRLGLLGGLQVSRHIAIELRPALAFNDSKLGITRLNLDMETYGQTIMIEGAGHVFYKFYAGKVIPYMLAGGSYRQPLNDASSTIRQMVRPSLAADVGIGLEKRLRHFSIAPEIRYSHGISNLQPIKGINSVKMHSIIFTVNLKS